MLVEIAVDDSAEDGAEADGKTRRNEWAYCKTVDCYMLLCFSNGYFSKFCRWDSFYFFKCPIKGRNTGKTTFKRDIDNFFLRVDKKTLRFFYSFSCQKVNKGHLCVIFKQVSKIGFADPEAKGNILKRERVATILRNIYASFSNLSGRFIRWCFLRR